MSSSTFSNPTNSISSLTGDAGALGINSFNPQSSVRAPRGNVTVEGSPVNWINWEVHSTGRSDADTFKVVLPIGGTTASLPLSYFVSADQIQVEIQATGAGGAATNILSAGGMDTLISGMVDHLSYEPDKATLTLTGRCLSSKLMDKKTSLKYQNLTASQIVTQLAGNAGLSPIVTDTQLKSGKYYQIDHARLTNQTSDWDLIQYLAREENSISFVKGKNLYFQPQGTQTPYIIDLTSPGYSTTDPVGQSNAVQIELTRNFVIGKGAKVTVNSWNLKAKKKITKVATAKGSSGEPLAFNYSYPNLAPDQAGKRATSKLHDIVQHEFTINIHMPADNLLNPQVPVQVIGTNSEFDQSYFVKSVHREMAFNQGYTMSFEAMNMAAKKTITTS